MASVTVHLTLPKNGKSSDKNFSYPLAIPGCLTSLREAVKSCQSEVNQLLTTVVENDRAAKRNGEKHETTPLDEDDDEEENGDSDEEIVMKKAKIE